MRVKGRTQNAMFKLKWNEQCNQLANHCINNYNMPMHIIHFYLIKPTRAWCTHCKRAWCYVTHSFMCVIGISYYNLTISLYQVISLHTFCGASAPHLWKQNCCHGVLWVVSLSGNTIGRQHFRLSATPNSGGSRGFHTHVHSSPLWWTCT